MTLSITFYWEKSSDISPYCSTKEKTWPFQSIFQMISVFCFSNHANDLVHPRVLPPMLTNTAAQDSTPVCLLTECWRWTCSPFTIWGSYVIRWRAYTFSASSFFTHRRPSWARPVWGWRTCLWAAPWACGRPHNVASRRCSVRLCPLRGRPHRSPSPRRQRCPLWYAAEKGLKRRNVIIERKQHARQKYRSK